MKSYKKAAETALGADMVKNEIAANRIIAKILIVISFLCFLTGVLTLIEVFKAAEAVTFGLFLFGVLFIPVAVLSLKSKAKRGLLKYLQIEMLMLSVFLLNIVVGYKIWLFYSVPVFLSVRYYNRKFTAIIGITALLLAIISSFTNAYLAPYFGIIDLNLVSFDAPGTVPYYSWLHNAVIRHGYNKEKIAVNGLLLSAFPNGIAIILSVLAANSLITNSRNMMQQARESLENEIQLLRQATMDELTGLYNRRAYDQDTRKLSSSPFAPDLIYISADVNGLKHANDTFGHSAGDEIIIAAAECLNNAFGRYGKVYRMGGDEFAAIIQADEHTFEQLRALFEQSTADRVVLLSDDLSVSYGYVTMREVEPSASIQSIEVLADRRMYDSKAAYYASDRS